MELREYFEIGLSIEAYKQLLTADQSDLHELYARRAKVAATASQTVRAAGSLNILVITEPWCGDSLAILPVVVRLFSEAGCRVRVVRRDEHPELIDRYLTNGGRAIPIVIVLDETFEERFHWGPRPAAAQAIVMDHKAAVAAGQIYKAEVHKKVRGFYARNQGKDIVAELLARMKRQA
jgi:hypothetical protein